MSSQNGHYRTHCRSSERFAARIYAATVADRRNGGQSAFKEIAGPLTRGALFRRREQLIAIRKLRIVEGSQDKANFVRSPLRSQEVVCTLFFVARSKPTSRARRRFFPFSYGYQYAERRQGAVAAPECANSLYVWIDVLQAFRGLPISRITADALLRVKGLLAQSLVSPPPHPLWLVSGKGEAVPTSPPRRRLFLLARRRPRSHVPSFWLVWTRR